MVQIRTSEQKRRYKTFLFLLDEKSLEDQTPCIICPCVQSYVYVKKFSTDWRSIFLLFHHISLCDPANHSRSADFCVIEISNYSTLNSIFENYHRCSTSSCVPFCRPYHGLDRSLIFFSWPAHLHLSASVFWDLKHHLVSLYCNCPFPLGDDKVTAFYNLKKFFV
jgi:hypothetical protein